MSEDARGSRQPDHHPTTIRPPATLSAASQIHMRDRALRSRGDHACEPDALRAGRPALSVEPRDRSHVLAHRLARHRGPGVPHPDTTNPRLTDVQPRRDLTRLCTSRSARRARPPVCIVLSDREGYIAMNNGYAGDREPRWTSASCPTRWWTARPARWLSGLGEVREVLPFFGVGASPLDGGPLWPPRPALASLRIERRPVPRGVGLFSFAATEPDHHPSTTRPPTTLSAATTLPVRPVHVDDRRPVPDADDDRFRWLTGRRALSMDRPRRDTDEVAGHGGCPLLSIGVRTRGRWCP